MSSSRRSYLLRVWRGLRRTDQDCKTGTVSMAKIAAKLSVPRMFTNFEVSFIFRIEEIVNFLVVDLRG